MKKIWVVLIVFALVFGQTGSLALADDSDMHETTKDSAESYTKVITDEKTDSDDESDFSDSEVVKKGAENKSDEGDESDSSDSKAVKKDAGDKDDESDPSDPETVKKDTEDTDKESESKEAADNSFSHGTVTADGDSYHIAVNYTKKAKLPKGVELKAKEITKDSGKYERYSSAAAKEICDGNNDTLPYVRFFDIGFYCDGQEYEPAAPVQVEIELEDGAVNEQKNGAKFSMVHFGEDGVEKVSAEVDKTIQFKADSFSVYGVTYIYTVDFFYQDAEYHLNGGNEMLLSELFDELGIKRDADEAVDVTFSSPKLLEVSHGDEEVKKVWKLKSLQPFLTSELLTVKFADGEMIVIAVTDAIGEGSCGSCTWTIDDDGVLKIKPKNKNSNGTLNSTNNKNSKAPWLKYADKIKSVVFEKNGTGEVKTDSNFSYAFNGCKNLVSVDFGELDTSAAENMSYLFNNCSSLKSIDVSNFDTTNVTNMSYLFNNCSSLNSIDVSNFDTTNVTNMSYLFNNCSSLNSIDVSNFDTTKVTKMSNLFYGCHSLVRLDLKNFKTPVLDKCDGAFSCNNLEYLDISNLDLSVCTKTEQFGEGKKLNTIIIGDKFYYTDDNEWPFPRGIWLTPDGSEKYGSQIARSLRKDSPNPGTYKKVSRNQLVPEWDVTYRILDLAALKDTVQLSADGPFRLYNGYVVFDYDNSDGNLTANPKDYKYAKVPGSCTLLYPDAAEDAYGNKYDLEFTFSNFEMFDVTLAEDTDTVTAGFFSLDNMNLGMMNGKFNIPYGCMSHDVTVTQRILKDGKPQSGTYAFNAYDIDLTHKYKEDEKHYYDTHAEGFNLVDGYDPETLTVDKDTSVLDLIGKYDPEALAELIEKYKGDWSRSWEGYRIMSTNGDNSSERSEFMVRADASGFKYVFTTRYDAHSKLGQEDQPSPLHVVKTDEEGNSLPGASMQMLRSSSVGVLPVTEGSSGYTYDISEFSIWQEWNTADKNAAAFLLYPGHYVIHETGAPDGYKLASDIIVQIDREYNFYIVTVDSSDGSVIRTPIDPIGGFHVVKMMDEPDTFDISAKKEWNDEDDKDNIRPSSVTVTLLADGKPVTQEGIVAEQTLDADNGWTYTWTGLNKCKAGKKIEYTVEEKKTDVITGVDGQGTYASEVTGSLENGFTVTNTHTPIVTPVSDPKAKPETKPAADTKSTQDTKLTPNDKPKSVKAKERGKAVNKSSAVSTGDAFDPRMCIVLMLVSMVTVVCLFFRKSA